MQRKMDIRICSDLDYENLIAEIYCDGKFVALISHEGDASNLRIEFPGSDQNEEAIARQVDLDSFEQAVQEAKQKLLDD